MKETQIENKNQNESQIIDLLSNLSLKEKISLLAGKDSWRTPPIDRLGIPSLVMTDGPHGVRSDLSGDRIQGPATAFPTGVSLAATWNPELIENVGNALADETRAMGCDILLGPCVNIIRHPLAGRNFESYSEDPFLAAMIGKAWVNGIQSKHIGASVKHFACNNQEFERSRGSSVIDERTLREIYLAQFENIIKDADPWTVMCSYNRINGVYASQNYFLLTEILKNEWGFEGVVVSDWGANHTIIESVIGGLDIEMPGPSKYYGNLLADAVSTWQIEEKIIDQAVTRILRMIQKSGKLDPKTVFPNGSVNTKEHQELARLVAEESITLLKNEGAILPINVNEIRSIAIIGPAATDMQISGGGSSTVTPPYITQPLDVIQTRLKGKIDVLYEKGCDNYVGITAAKNQVLSPLQDTGNGINGFYYAGTEFSGDPLISRIDNRIDFWWLSFAPLDQTPESFSVRWNGYITPQQNGRHTLGVENTGVCRVWLDENLIIDHSPLASKDFFHSSTASHALEMTEGQKYLLRIEYIRPRGLDFPHIRFLFGFTPLEIDDHRIENAVNLAKKSQVAIVFAGYPEGYESEGNDRPNLDLTGKQNELISAVAKVNPNTVVILNVGSPITMPWLDHVAGVILAYYPGLEGGNAITSVLLGEANPSGSLSVSFPKKISDTPAYINYPGYKEVIYGEGIFVGYRYYEMKEIEPLFAFGHGLSYTTFKYSDLNAPDEFHTNEPICVSLKVKNTGKIAGKETVQLYIHDYQSTLIRPPKELKGFTKVFLEPGEEKTVYFNLDQRSFSFYNPDRKSWTAEPGLFEFLVGSSSQDIRLRTTGQLAR